MISSDPEITVLGNGVTILDGDTTPSTTDGSDFGTTTLGGASVTHTFTVRNDGNATLTTSAPSLPTGFTLVEGLSSSIAAGGSDTFTVRLDTTSTGFKSGQISFADNDSDENPFNFAITGTVLSPPVTLYTFGFFYNDMIANPFGGDDYYGTVAADSSFGYFVNQKITTSFGYYWIIGSLGTTGQPSGRVAIEGYDDRAGTPPKTYNPYYYSTLGYSFGTGLGNEYDILGPEGAYHAIGANRAEYIHIPPTVTAPPDDFYLTGSSGILWQNTDGTAAIWKMNGATPTAAPVVGNPGAAWQVAGSGDFNRDGYADILWQNTDGTVAFWEMNGGTAIAAPVIGNPGASWRAVGTGEFIGEGFSGDILWRNTDGRVAIWELNGKNVTAASVIGNPGTSWRVAGTGDFYGNGYSDILWQNSDGTVAIWAMNGATPMATPVIGKPGASWKAIGAGDFNRDGYSDILWQNTNGAVAIWEMNGATVIGAPVIGNPGASWKAIGAGDFNRDGYSDILWQNTDGAVAIWEMNGATVIAAPVIGNPGTSWHPILGGGSSTIVAGSAGAASASSAGGAGFGFGDNRRSRPHPERNRRERRHHAGISERRQRSASASARFDDAACRPHHTSGHPLRVMRR